MSANARSPYEEGIGESLALVSRSSLVARGLGLSVARTLARLMDGNLTYHHTGGDESVFTLSLPQVAVFNVA